MSYIYSNTNKSFYLSESVMGLKRNRVASTIIIFQCIVCLVLMAITHNDFKQGDNKLREINDFYNKIHYSLHDKADKDGSFDIYLNSENEYYKLKGFVEELRNNKDINFVNTIFQPVTLINQSIPDKFFFQYEEGYAEPADFEKVNDIIIQNSWVKGIQISKNVKEIFNLKMDSGTFFCEDDYILDDGPIHSVILGNEYKDYFYVGDKIRIGYLYNIIDFQIIGFFKKDTNVVRNNNIINIDRYVCIPAFTELNYTIYPNLAAPALGQQANGQILTLDSTIDVAKMIEQYSLEYGTFKFEVYNDNRNETKNMVKISDDSLNKIRTMNNVLLIFTIVSITMSILSRVQKDYYRFGVQLLCGASIYNILNQIAIELFLIINMALVFSLIISFIILGFGTYQLVLILVSCIIFCSSMIIPSYVLIREGINRLIRREE